MLFSCLYLFFFFFFNDTATTEIYTLSLHDALPIWELGEGIMADRKSLGILGFMFGGVTFAVMLTAAMVVKTRSEEHTSELQSQSNLVCRLLLEKKKKK